MEFGIFTEFHVREGKTQNDAYMEHLDEAVMAEKMGFDSVWLAEYHFAPERSLLSSPLLIGTAIASRTERIRIGGAVFVVPLIHPLNMAEQAAILDHISQGRFEFGIGRSALTMFYRGFNMEYAETRDRFFEGLEVVLKAWNNETFSHHGQYWHFDDVTIVPKPYQKPHPPIRIGTLSADTFPLLGSMGYNISFFAGAPIPQLKEQLTEYRKAWKEAGHPGEPDANMRLAVYVAETTEKAHSEPEASVKHQQDYDYRVTSRYSLTEDRAERSRASATMPYSELLKAGRYMYGTPEYVTERIQEFKEELGISGMILEFNTGGQIPYERVLGSMKMFTEKVMPNFR